MNNNYNTYLYFNEQTSTNINKALIQAIKILEIIAQQKGYKECSMLQKLKSILNTLNLTQNENQQIAKQTIELIIGLFDEQLVCNDVWELLHELFKNPSQAEEIVEKLKQILTDLHIQLEREE